MSRKMEIERQFLRCPDGHFFLFGPRGTGKSTWLDQVFPKAARLDLLAPEEQRRFAARPERLREVAAALPAGADLLVDEVQRVPALLPVVHQIMEAPGSPRFVLTGSSARQLRRAGVDLLAGRAVVRRMHPFLAAELGDPFDLESALSYGLLPLVRDARDPEDALAAYVALYVEQEVKAEGLVRNLDSFQRFLEAISFSHAGVLNLSEVARECAVGRKTVEGYLEILEDLLLAFRVPVFRRRAGRRASAHPKFYFADTGVFRSLRPSGPLDRPEEIRSAALEGLVAQHLRGWLAYSGTSGAAGPRLYFFRSRAGSEVDFVLYGPGVFRALEVKHAGRVRPADLRSLRRFREDYPEAECRFGYLGAERLEIDGIRCLPVAELLSGVIPGKPLP